MHFSLQYFIISSLGLIRSCIALQYITVSIFLCAFNKILLIFICKLHTLVFSVVFSCLFSSTIPDFVVVIWTRQIKVIIPSYYLSTYVYFEYLIFLFTYFLFRTTAELSIYKIRDIKYVDIQKNFLLIRVKTDSMQYHDLCMLQLDF